MAAAATRCPSIVYGAKNGEAAAVGRSDVILKHCQIGIAIVGRKFRDITEVAIPDMIETTRKLS